MTTITLINLTSETEAEPLVRCLQGKSFMDLEVAFAPVGGSFDVLVTTHRADTSEEELREMVLLVLCGTIQDLGSKEVLRAMAVGCDRLNDGDPTDRKTADIVEARVAEHFNKVRQNNLFFDAE